MITGSITMTCRVHPSSPYALNTAVGLNAGVWDARFICVYVPAIIKTVTSVSGSTTVSQCNGGARWYWSSVPSGAEYVDVNSVTDITQLPSKFNQSKQIIVCRQAFYNNTSSWKEAKITAISVTITGTFEKLDKVTAGTTVITSATMTTLKNYLDSMATYLQMGTGTSITAPAVGAAADNSNWTNYIIKANALPHVSGLAVPTEGSTISASYYNNIVDKVNP